MKKRVVVGLSGGVDSSVAAALLKEQGYDVIGLFMRNWDSTTNNDILGNPTIDDDICPQEIDYQDAEKVANKLGVPIFRVDFIKEYWDNVFTYFLDEYKKGRTPNPDILCNKYIKFDAFIEHAKQFNPDYIAMGHYARVEHGDHPKLLRGIDNNKDQTYFLSQLTEKQLSHTLFPVGELTKQEVRDIAHKYDLATKDKKDSTGICFIGERDFNRFLANYLPSQSGNMITEDGDVLNTHQGLMYYTIGQRKGLGIGGSNQYDNKPWFVIGKNLETNDLIIGQGFHHPVLYSDSCIVEDVNLINLKRFEGPLYCTAKFRYRQQDHPVTIEFNDDDTLQVTFEQDIRAITPGQAAVFYDGEVCLGGGFIKAAYKNGQKRQY
ncbi:tRNA 2-thiouridine(34) synthase MnmA [Candidatus Xianfuyuplasma coldseepsis]|uniref:tRNA-specific 2-thiouridylase MnmA n=1 Tax=Candidatus Xianfuyuplasma coldseepsis TaxID=2782163 RepID=A0A7L7KSL7_9MOLU|nr:tRNA 2-thiouridine(34) synthase MnmA [Xianfuyuplasma coldseepsis]QMS85707.1 tRNA 2-thiouridine(34) synthase MnmA [Xianfuyuplasma coldseepsis]